MIICHSGRWIFLKTMKTGGSSIELALNDYLRGNDICTSIVPTPEQEGVPGYCRIRNEGTFRSHARYDEVIDAIGRDTFDSYFKFTIERNPWDKVVSLFWWKVRERLIWRMARKRFNRWVFNNLRDFRFSNESVYYQEGRSLCDYVIRFENLQAGFEEVSELIGLPDPSPLPRLKTRVRKHKDMPYQSYYDEQTIQIVSSVHKNIIRDGQYVYDSGNQADL